MTKKADAGKKEKIKGNEKTGPGKVVSVLLVLTMALSALAASLPMVSAQPLPPEVTGIEVIASPSNIQPESTSTITATVTWVNQPAGDGFVIFFEIIGPTYGAAIGNSAKTNVNGEASVIFSSEGATEGTVTVKAYWIGDVTISDTTTVTITEAQDEEPPEISAVASSATMTTATITWNTNEVADSLVKYGTTSGAYTLQQYDAVDVTSHSIGLTGLVANTTYYYVVNSTDPSGNPAQSAEFNFTTLEEGALVQFNVTLGVGWNLISIPLELTDTSLDAVVGSNAVAMDEIYEFDNVAGYKSSMYTGAAWAGAVATIQPGKGYWYNRKGAQVTLTVTGQLPTGTITTPIYTGWNLVGYQSTQSQGLGIVNAPVSLDEIYEFDNVVGYSSSMYTGVAWAGAVTTFDPGKGYWYNRKGSPFDWVYTP
jgi:hypothetical protein